MEKVEQKAILPETPAIGISLTVAVRQDRNIVFQTYVPQEADAEQVNNVLDKINRVADRMEAVYRLDELRRNYRKDKDAIEVTKSALSRYEENKRKEHEGKGRHGAFKLSQTEIAEKNNLQTNLERGELLLKRYEDDIAECEAKIDGSYWEPDKAE